MSCDFGHITLSIPGAIGACAKRGNNMQSNSLLAQRVENVLDFMQDKRIFFMDLLIHILDGRGPRCSPYRRHVFDNLESTLTRIDQHKRGRDILKKWALSLFCKVDREMRKVKRAFTMKTSEITPELVEASGRFPAFKASSRRKPLSCANSCVQVFRRDMQGRRERRTQWSYVHSLATSFLADAAQIISVIVSQMAHHRSHYVMQFQDLLGIFWWSSGASRQSIHTLQRRRRRRSACDRTFSAAYIS
jgi:hypothetical protein